MSNPLIEAFQEAKVREADEFKPWGRYLWSAEQKFDDAFRRVSGRNAFRDYFRMNPADTVKTGLKKLMPKINERHLPEDIESWMEDSIKADMAAARKRSDEIDRKNQAALNLHYADVSELASRISDYKKKHGKPPTMQIVDSWGEWEISDEKIKQMLA